jgi:hypothetical protein
LLNNSAVAHAPDQARESRRDFDRKEPTVHEKQKLIERVVVGLVVSAVSVDVLSAELPRLIPYLVVLALIFVVVRLVLFHTRKW